MHLVVGEDIWQELGTADLLLITTNSCINRFGELVMGRGLASQAKKRFPFLPEQLARQITPRRTYGVAFADAWVQGTLLGAFQVKYHFREIADLELIRFSCDCLRGHAPDFERIALNFPGIGYGLRSEDEIEPIISKLPDNVYVYKR